MCLRAIGEFLPYLVGFSQKLAIVFDGEFSFPGKAMLLIFSL